MKRKAPTCTYYYGLFGGHQSGVYDSYAEALIYMAGVPGAKCRKFESEDQAQEFADTGKSAISVVDRGSKRTKEEKQIAAHGAAELVARLKSRPGAILVYTDGSCRKGNPGRAGWGFLVDDEKAPYESSGSLGPAKTNNIAELTALLHAFEYVRKTYPHKLKKIHFLTDSKYAIGLLTLGWRAKENKELINQVKAAFDPSRFELHHVPAHCGVENNERVDKLASEAALRG